MLAFLIRHALQLSMGRRRRQDMDGEQDQHREPDPTRAQICDSDQDRRPCRTRPNSIASALAGARIVPAP
jgi:hypothetical protein